MITRHGRKMFTIGDLVMVRDMDDVHEAGRIWRNKDKTYNWLLKDKSKIGIGANKGEAAVLCGSAWERTIR